MIGRLTDHGHRRTNGQVERMNRTLKAAVERYHYDSRDQLRAHLQLFVDACNHARRPNTLRGLTPYGFICQVLAKELERFRLDRHTTSRDRTVQGCVSREEAADVRAGPSGAE